MHSVLQSDDPVGTGPNAPAAAGQDGGGALAVAAAPAAKAGRFDARGGGGAAPLPRPLTSFVGREREVAAAAALLASGRVRLLTLTGPGGVGKTRLALRVAETAGPAFGGEIVFVSLAAIGDPAQVLVAIARAAGVRGGGDEPLLSRLRAGLGAAALLLVLDNAEQVTGAGGDVAALLGACPGWWRW